MVGLFRFSENRHFATIFSFSWQPRSQPINPIPTLATLVCHPRHPSLPSLPPTLTTLLNEQSSPPMFSILSTPATLLFTLPHHLYRTTHFRHPPLHPSSSSLQPTFATFLTTQVHHPLSPLSSPPKFILFTTHFRHSPYHSSSPPTFATLDGAHVCRTELNPSILDPQDL